MKSYTITDLFKTEWGALNTLEHAEVIYLSDRLKQTKAENLEKAWGHTAIMLLRALRKNKSAVAKITIEQAVDCVRDLTFITQPWYYFPVLENHAQLEAASMSATPPAYLQGYTFSQLVYIDSLFSKFAILSWKATTGKLQAAIPYLDKMIGVIYTPANLFDENKIAERGQLITRHIKDYERTVVLHTWANIKERIIKECPNLFPQAAQTVATDQPPKDSEPMWQNLLFDLSETLAYQGMDRAKAAPIYEALNYLEKKAIEATTIKSKS